MSVSAKGPWHSRGPKPPVFSGLKNFVLHPLMKLMKLIGQFVFSFSAF
jgi:hypothetical protein